MGEGISPDKKRRRNRQMDVVDDEDFETQQNKEKTRKILQNFDFNKLFYPSHTVNKKRNACSLNEARRRTKHGDDGADIEARPTRGHNLPSQPPTHKHGHDDLDDLRMGQPNLVNLSKTAA